MEINPLQPNRNITQNWNIEPANNANTDTANYSNTNYTVTISQEARDLANKTKADEKAIMDTSENNNIRDKIEPKLAENLSTVSKRSLHYYFNDNNDLAIKVIDKKTKKVIREIPPEEVQKLKTAIKSIMEEMNNTEDLQATLNKLV